MWIPRHQAGGPLSQFIFEQYPNDRQQAEIAEYCTLTYGTHHPVKGMPWSLTFEERKPLGPSDSLPKAEPAAENVSASAGAATAELSIVGRGEVRNPGR